MQKIWLAVAVTVLSLAVNAEVSVFDDVKVWYKGAAGNAVGAQDSGGNAQWSDNISMLKSQPTLKSGGSLADGGSYYWYGYRIRYDNEHVKMPYANIDLGESPCFIYWPSEIKTNEWVTMTVDGEEMNLPVVNYKMGAFKLNDWMSDWAEGSVCSNWTCVLRFKPYQAVNPVSGNAMAVLGVGNVYQSGDKASGVSLSLNTLKRFSEYMQPRMFVGDQQINWTDWDIKAGSWVDVGLVVNAEANGAGKLELVICHEDGETNVIRSATKTYSGNIARPFIGTHKFRLGSNGDNNARTIVTNGISSSLRTGFDFLGAFHQVAFWDRALSMNELREAMGRPGLVKVGLQRDNANGEFAATKTTVAAEGDWENLNPVLTEANPSATITFQCSKQWAGLPQFLRVAACDDSDDGTLTVALNDEPVGTLRLNAGKFTHMYIAANKIVEGENSLSLTRATGTTLKLDAVTLAGSWRYGLDAPTDGIKCFGYDYSNIDGVDYHPAGGNDVFHGRSISSPGSKVATYHFYIPEDLSGWCKGTLRFRVQNTSNVVYDRDVYVNGQFLTQLHVKNGDVRDVNVPAQYLVAGWNTASYGHQGGWTNMDCHQFTIEPFNPGLTIIVR